MLPRWLIEAQLGGSSQLTPGLEKRGPPECAGLAVAFEEGLMGWLLEGRWGFERNDTRGPLGLARRKSRAAPDEPGAA